MRGGAGGRRHPTSHAATDGQQRRAGRRVLRRRMYACARAAGRLLKRQASHQASCACALYLTQVDGRTGSVIGAPTMTYKKPSAAAVQARLAMEAASSSAVAGSSGEGFWRAEGVMGVGGRRGRFRVPVAMERAGSCGAARSGIR